MATIAASVRSPPESIKVLIPLLSAFSVFSLKVKSPRSTEGRLVFITFVAADAISLLTAPANALFKSPPLAAPLATLPAILPNTSLPNASVTAPET